MYIESLHYKNIGPISELNIRFRKNEKNHPIPLIIVGKNGSGKSILLSNIVDAFYELAGKAYLLITGTNFSSAKLSVRNFQNLIGRTGRSGVYTEGDVIVTESKLYDERISGRGYYKWKDTRGLFDEATVEKCGSSILNIVRDYAVTYKVKLSGSEIVNYICENIYDNNWTNELLNVLLEEIKEIDKSDNINYYRQEIFEHYVLIKSLWIQ